MSCERDLKILINPATLPANSSAAFLTRCFDASWTESMARWYLERPFAGERPDRVMLADGERIVAGCGLAYRVLRTPDGAVHRVSIVVAAATLPGERGRGCYARVLEAAVGQSARRGCTALLGFVTADNATGRGLRRLGATTVPSLYIVSRAAAVTGGAGLLCVRPAAATRAWPERASARLCGTMAAGFHYPDLSGWLAQMVRRPDPVLALRVGASCRALVECTADTDRLQWLDGDRRERAAAIRAIAAHAYGRRRRFFMYSTCADDEAVARRLGLRARPGFMMALATAAGGENTVRDWQALTWQVQSGDRM